METMASYQKTIRWISYAYAVGAQTLALGAVPNCAWAQTSATQTARVRWEIEPYAGTGSATTPASGAVNIPVSGGGQFTAPSGLTARAPSSWFYGDGPSLLPVTRVDPVMRTPGVTGSRLTVLGARVTWWVLPRLGVELAGSYDASPARFSKATLAQVDAVRASFVTAFNALFAGDPVSYVNPVVSSTAQASSHGAAVMTTIGVKVPLGGVRIVPYLSAAVGLANRAGDGARLTLSGRYQFQLPGSSAVDQTSALTLRYLTAARRTVGVIGGGVNRFLTSRAGLCLDVRAAWEGVHDVLLLDTMATSVPGTPGGFVEQQAPGPQSTRLVFSNTSAVRTSLSGPQQSGFRALDVTGGRWQFNATIGWFWRF